MQDPLRWAAFLRCAGHVAMAIAAMLPASHWLTGIIVGAGSLLLAAAHALDGR